MQLKDLLVKLNETSVPEEEEKAKLQTEENVAFITFKLKQKEFAIDINEAREIIKISNLIRNYYLWKGKIIIW